MRTATSPGAIVASVRCEVQALDPQLPLFGVCSLDGQILETLATPRFGAVLRAGFPLIAATAAIASVNSLTRASMAIASGRASA